MVDNEMELRGEYDTYIERSLQFVLYFTFTLY